MSTNNLQAIFSSTDPSHYFDYRKLFKDMYHRCKQTLSPYSYLKFAEDIGLKADQTMRLVMAGKRKITNKAAERILATSGWRGHKRRYFELLVQFNNCKRAGERQSLFEKLRSIRIKNLPTDEGRYQSEFFAKWYHPVIWELAAHDSFLMEPKWIQK